MLSRFSGRSVIAGVLALYAFVVGLVLPFHLTEDVGGPRDSGTAGEYYGVSCGDRNCHIPSHHHHQSHSHDPATCPTCAHARMAATPAPAVSSPLPTAQVVEAAPALVSAAPRTAERTPRTARGPPVSLS